MLTIVLTFTHKADVSSIILLLFSVYCYGIVVVFSIILFIVFISLFYTIIYAILHELRRKIMLWDCDCLRLSMKL